MKIIIAGSGIAGFSTYLHLHKHLPNSPGGAPHTIHI
jgi:glycine/D-amino acid oxidase-like deaminating enzyme